MKPQVAVYAEDRQPPSATLPVGLQGKRSRVLTGFANKSRATRGIPPEGLFFLRLSYS